MYFLLTWWQRNGWVRAVAAGLLLGAAVTIRYTEGLPLLPLVTVALLNLRWHSRRSWIETVALGAAWALPVLLLLTYNWFTLHHLTGYDPTNESTGFRWEYFQNNWETMTRHLYNTGLFFVLPFSVLGLIWMWRWNWRIALVLWAWVVPNLLVYSAYYWAPDGSWIAYLRFFLTIMPALALAAVWSFVNIAQLAATSTVERPSLVPKLAIAVLLLIGCGVNLNTALAEMELDLRTTSAINMTGQQVLKACPADSLIFAPNQTLNYLQLIGDYRLYDIQQFNRAMVQSMAHVDPDEPNGLQPQRAMEMYDRLKDFSEQQLINEQNALMTEALTSGKRVFFVMSKPMTPQFMRFVPRRLFQTNVVASWDELPVVRAVRRQQFGFAKALPTPAMAAAEQRSIVWQILEITPAPPPPPPVAPKPRPRATTRPTTQRISP
jgi:hypothetical protein